MIFIKNTYQWERIYLEEVDEGLIVENQRLRMWIEYLKTVQHKREKTIIAL